MKKLFFILVATSAAMQSLAQQNTSKPSSKLEEMIVTANRIETPLRQIGSSISLMDIKDIQAHGQTNIADVLRTSPGIAVSNAGGAGKDTALRIRGEESYRTLILMDGIKLSDPTLIQTRAQIQQIGSDNIERVEILRGPQGMIYGADAGGVINIISRKPTEAFEGNITHENGRYDSRRNAANIGGSSEKLQYSFAGSDFHTDGFNSSTRDSTLLDRDGYDNTTGIAKAGITLTDNIQLNVGHQDIDAENEYDNCYDNSFSISNICKDTYKHKNTFFSGDIKTGDVSHKLVNTHSTIKRDFFTDKIFQFGFDGQMDETQYYASIPASHNGVLIAGLDQEKQQDNGEHITRDQTGTYLEWQGTPTDKLSYSVGVRQDDNDDFGIHNSYRSSVAYLDNLQNGDEIKWRGSYGTGFRAPSLFEMSYNERPYLTTQPPALNEETSKGFDIGVDYYFSGGALIELTYFDQLIEDMIAYYFDPQTFDDYYLQSDGISNSKGIELAGELPVNESISLISSYTYNDAEDGNGKRRLRRPRHIGSIGIRYLADSGKLEINTFARTAQDSIDDDNKKLDNYETLDINISYQLQDNMKVYVRGENVFDADYQEAVGYYTAGAAFYTGIRYSF